MRHFHCCKLKSNILHVIPIVTGLSAIFVQPRKRRIALNNKKKNIPLIIDKEMKKVIHRTKRFTENILINKDSELKVPPEKFMSNLTCAIISLVNDRPL